MSTSSSYTPPVAPTPSNDFFRSAAGTALPDGATDVTENIARTGNTGFGNVQSATPIARVDIAAGTRTGTDRRVATTQPLYVTGGLPDVNSTAIPGVTPTGGAEFMHSNQTQGVGIGVNGIYAIGSSTDQDLTLKQSGSGAHRRIWNNTTQAISEERNQSNFAVNSGFRHDHYVQNNIVMRAYIYDTAGDGVNYRHLVNYRHNGAARRGYIMKTSELVTSSSSIALSANTLNKDKLVMYNETWTGEQFMGYGMESGAMTAQTYSDWDFRWYNAPSDTTATLLMELTSTGRLGVGITASGQQAANLDVRSNAVIGPVVSEGIRNGSVGANMTTVFALGNTGPAITAGSAALRMAREGTAGTAYNMTAEWRMGRWAATLGAASQAELWLGNGNTNTPNTRVIHFRSDGRINTPLLPTFNNDNQAGTGGLVAGDWYKTGAGDLKIKL